MSNPPTLQIIQPDGAISNQSHSAQLATPQKHPKSATLASHSQSPSPSTLPPSVSVTNTISVLSYNIWGIFNSKDAESRIATMAREKFHHFDIICLQENFSRKHFDTILAGANAAYEKKRLDDKESRRIARTEVPASPFTPKTPSFLTSATQRSHSQIVHSANHSGSSPFTSPTGGPRPQRFSGVHSVSSFVGPGLAIITRFPILSHNFYRFPLQGAPERVYHGDYFCNKGVTVTRLQVVNCNFEGGLAALRNSGPSPFSPRVHMPNSGPTSSIVVYNTHLTAQYEKYSKLDSYASETYAAVRLSQAAFLADIIATTATEEDNVIVCGDFNCTPQSPEFALISSIISQRSKLTKERLLQEEDLEDSDTDDLSGGSVHLAPMGIVSGVVSLAQQHNAHCLVKGLPTDLTTNATYSLSNSYNSSPTSYFQMLSMVEDLPAQLDHVLYRHHYQTGGGTGPSNTSNLMPSESMQSTVGGSSTMPPQKLVLRMVPFFYSLPHNTQQKLAHDMSIHFNEAAKTSAQAIVMFSNNDCSPVFETRKAEEDSAQSLNSRLGNKFKGAGSIVGRVGNGVFRRKSIVENAKTLSPEDSHPKLVKSGSGSRWSRGSPDESEEHKGPLDISLSNILARRTPLSDHYGVACRFVLAPIDPYYSRADHTSEHHGGRRLSSINAGTRPPSETNSRHKRSTSATKDTQRPSPASLQLAPSVGSKCRQSLEAHAFPQPNQFLCAIDHTLASEARELCGIVLTSARAESDTTQKDDMLKGASVAAAKLLKKQEALTAGKGFDSVIVAPNADPLQWLIHHLRPATYNFEQNGPDVLYHVADRSLIIRFANAILKEKVGCLSVSRKSLMRTALTLFLVPVISLAYLILHSASSAGGLPHADVIAARGVTGEPCRMVVAQSEGLSTSTVALLVGFCSVCSVGAAVYAIIGKLQREVDGLVLANAAQSLDVLAGQGI